MNNQLHTLAPWKVSPGTAFLTADSDIWKLEVFVAEEPLALVYAKTVEEVIANA